MTETEAAADYDPTAPAPPEREPPRRSTAPQSEFTARQVAIGCVVMVCGLALSFGLPLLVA